MPLKFLISLVYLFCFYVTPFSVVASDHHSFTTVSGRKVSITAINRKLSGIYYDNDELSKIIFEYDSNTNSLVSHFESFTLPPASDNFIVPRQKIPTFVNGIPEKQKVSDTIFSRSEDGYVFIFNSGKNKSLSTVWGPSILLHQLDDDENSHIFLNHFHTLQSIPNELADISSKVQLAKPVVCPHVYKFEVGLAYDSSFCSLFGNDYGKVNDYLLSLVFDVSSVFRSTVCVSMSIVYFDSFCSTDRRKDNKFKAPVDFNSTKSNIRSRKMLELISKEWDRTTSKSAHRDAAFLFTGYIDDSPLAGATYRAQACNEKLSFAWVERAVPIVFAHEVGHMLGGRHTKEGFMRSQVVITRDLQLSLNSQVQIRRFVERDSRSWCLKRDGNSFGRLKQLYKWTMVGSYVYDNFNNVNVSDITFADINSDGKRDDLISLITERNPKNGEIKATYRISFNVTCVGEGTCSLKKKSVQDTRIVRDIDLKFKPFSYGIGIAYAHIRGETTGDMIISYLSPEKLNNGKVKPIPYYKIGYGVDHDGSPPTEWSEQRKVMKFSGENVQCASITTGHIKSSKSIDILYVQIDKKKYRNVLTYNIGFDLSPDGIAKGGWTGPIEVPGWYGKDVTSVSASIVDVDKNGIPDLVLYHVDNTKTFKIGYIRVGKDINPQTGKVTRGWTDFVRAAIFLPFETRRAGAMDVSVDIENKGFPVVATSQREFVFMTKFKGYTMYFGARVLTDNFMRTSKNLPLVEDLSGGCSECYTFEESKQCQKDLSRCSSTIDEINLNTTIGYYDLSPSPEFYMKESEDQPYNPIRPKKPKTDSIYCYGFHYLYANYEGCEVIDRYTVMAKGLEQLFLKEISNTIDEGDIEESTSLFEDPAGIHNGKPIVARVVIWNTKLNYRDSINTAFSRLKKKVDFKSFVDPLKDLKRSRVKSKDGKKWIVEFRFDESFIDGDYV